MTEVAPGSRIETRVRYSETDQMGRAHHMQYLAWFECGRTALMRENGVAYAQLEARGVYLPVAYVEVEYRRGIGYDETVWVTTRVEEVRSRAVTFGYEARASGNGELLARGATRLVCTGEDGKPMRLPGDVVAVLHRLAAGS